MSRAPEKIGRLFTLYMRLDLETILITVKNSILLGNTNTFEINSFSYGGVSYPTEDALSKIEEIRNYVNDTVDEVLKEILNQLPNCISNGQRIQEIHYKQVYSEHEGKTCVEYISFFIDAPNDISDLPSEIIVYPLIIKPNNEIYSFDFRFERIFIRKQGSDENAIVGIATLKNELDTNEFYTADEVLFVSYAEAEAIKLFSNTYLAMRISFFNELDTYAEQKGLNTKSIIEGVCLDPRIGQYYNNPSFGYGGYCLPKDTKQLLADYGAIPQSITQATIESNKLRKNYIINQIKQVLNDKYFSKAGMRNCKDIVIGIYRLTMKCNSDNYRQSAIWEIIEALEKENYSIIVYEPMCDEQLAYKLAITKNIISFKKRCNIILANRYDDELYDVLEKVYTRDIFGRD